MTLTQFIKNNRREIVEAIKSYYDYEATSIEELKEWVNNDEGLYRWARSEGVKI